VIQFLCMPVYSDTNQTQLMFVYHPVHDTAYPTSMTVIWVQQCTHFNFHSPSNVIYHPKGKTQTEGE
jgi:hypothetical protein